MNLVTEVVGDLYEFALETYFKRPARKMAERGEDREKGHDEGQRGQSVPERTLQLNPAREIVEIKTREDFEQELIEKYSNESTSESAGESAKQGVGGAHENESTAQSNTVIPMPGKVSEEARAPRKNTVMYVSSTYTTLRSEPSILRDTNLGTLTYGTMVMVLEAKDGWAKILRGEDEGWVETSDLADRAAYILPQFVKGEANAEDDPNTLRLRAIIGDEFSCGAAGLPLQAHEYVLYKLQRKGIGPAWPKMRPRNPGRWADILSHAEGVTLSVEPKSGSVMEFFTKDSIGRLMFVEAVFPDGAIQTSEVNWPDEGIYNERVMKKEEWETANPVFIVFS